MQGKQPNIKLGEKFNYLTIISDLGLVATGLQRQRKVLVKCDCGNTKEVIYRSLKNGKPFSCGCVNKEFHRIQFTKHSLHKHPLYTVWNNMKRRCVDHKKHNYPHYGGKGVSVCPEWLDFSVFYNWAINNGWQKGLQLDKDIKSKKLNLPPLLYSPDRCQFVTRKENQRNRSISKLFLYNGEYKTLPEWAEIFKMSYSQLEARIRRKGWNNGDVLFSDKYSKLKKIKK